MVVNGRVGEFRRLSYGYTTVKTSRVLLSMVSYIHITGWAASSSHGARVKVIGATSDTSNY